jgi:diacylglycerol kinase family enzyme
MAAAGAAAPPDAAAAGAGGAGAACVPEGAPQREWLVCAFVNRLSGGQTGARVFAAAQQAGLDAVYDLSQGGPRCERSARKRGSQAHSRDAAVPLLRPRRGAARQCALAPACRTHAARARAARPAPPAPRAAQRHNHRMGLMRRAARPRRRSGPLQALAAAPATARGALLLCFGGDGTFNWVASTVLALRSEGFDAFRPDLVPCPLGTGNDLARSLGWGARFPGFRALPRFVAAARDAPRGTGIDVWRVAFANSVRVGLARSARAAAARRALPQPRCADVAAAAHGHKKLQGAKMGTMQNYFSVGVDAEVSRRFDAARTAHPERFRSQASNKLRYGAAPRSSHAAAPRGCRALATLTRRACASQPRWVPRWRSAARRASTSVWLRCASMALTWRCPRAPRAFFC